MPRYKIADVVVDLTTRFEETAHWYSDYRTDEPLMWDKPITAPDEEIEYLVREGIGITEGIAENMVLCRRFNRMLLHFEGSYIHASALMHDGRVYLFSGHSGVGKSTLTTRWCKKYPDRAKVINDDKPTFRIIDGKCIIYGTPFAGGTDIQLNTSAELGAVVFLEQSDTNRLEKLSIAKALPELLEQTPPKRNPSMGVKMLSLYEEILTRYPFYKLSCTDSDDAVSTAYKITELI